MSSVIEIYGIKITIPDPKENVEDWGYPDDITQQYWRRYELPDYFQDVEYDKDGNALLTLQQRQYALEEVRRCKEGFHFFNNGVITYITGKHYFYLKYWKLEDDIYPDYRDTSRRYFLFLDYWEKILWCLGIVRGKKRREGATSEAVSNLVYEAIFFKNSICGLTSKSQTDAKTAFTGMVSFGYRQLPVFLKPKQLNNKDSVTEFVFAHKSVSNKDGRGKVIDSDTGHRSKIDYRAPGVNAYDSGRLSRGLFDEGGKWEPQNPFAKFISIVSKTMVKGGKRVGFMECPSTVNEMTKGGGAEFEKVWKNSDQFKYERTPYRLVRYFTPAYDGYVGFIDRYGMSVIEEPTEEQYEYLVENFVGIGDLTEEDIKKGAKKYLLSLRENKTGDALEEEIRMNPFNEEEMFMYAGFGCEFNAANIQMQLKKLEEEPVFLRQSRLILKKDVIKPLFPGAKEKEKRYIGFMDDEKGGWFIYEKPTKENYISNRGGYLEPLNTSMYSIGVDTTQDRIAVEGSQPVILVFKKSCIVEGEETGLKPVAMWISKTRLDIHFDEEVLKACMWYGCKANYEIDRRTDFYRYFCQQNAQAFLEWTPKIAQNPLKKNFKLEYGTRSGDPFQLAQQLQIAKMYIDGTSNEVFNGHVHRIVFPSLLKELLKYDHLNREKSDQAVALQMALLPVFGEMQHPKIMPQKIKQLLPRFKIKQYG